MVCNSGGLENGLPLNKHMLNEYMVLLVFSDSPVIGLEVRNIHQTLTELVFYHSC